jgi:hypothetical protein
MCDLDGANLVKQLGGFRLKHMLVGIFLSEVQSVRRSMSVQGEGCYSSG